jgi:hypothetical protein
MLNDLNETVLFNIKEIVNKKAIYISDSNPLILKYTENNSNNLFSVSKISSVSIFNKNNDEVYFEDIKDIRILLSILKYLESLKQQQKDDFIQIEWGIIDFETRALEIEQDSKINRKIFERSKFAQGLKILEDMHDCNFGISWDDIDYVLENYCKFE